MDHAISDRDTCIYLNTGTPAWASPDILITAPDASGSMATAPTSVTTVNDYRVNTVQINVNRKGDSTTMPCLDALGGTNPPSDYIQIDLWICDPNAGSISPNSPNVKLIRDFSGGTLQSYSGRLTASPPAGGSSPVTVHWKLPENPPTVGSMETNGHKCLIARAYPNGSADNINFHVGDDEHYAQRNICINVCTSPCGVDLWTENLDDAVPRQFSLRVVEDLNPSRGMLQTVRQALDSAKLELGRVAEKPPAKGFGLELKNFPDAKFVQNAPPDLSSTTPGGPGGCMDLLLRLLGQRKRLEPTRALVEQAPKRGLSPAPDVVYRQPSYEAKVTLAPSQFSRYAFTTDLSGEPTGTLHIFHIMEIENGAVLGGVTVLALKG